MKNDVNFWVNQLVTHLATTVTVHRIITVDANSCVASNVKISRQIREKMSKGMQALT